MTPELNDKIYAERIRECLKNLEQAIQEAKKARLTVSIDIEFHEIYENLKIYRLY